jgi:tight adherence protein B
VYLQAIASELRAGGNLRAALESAADRTPGLDLAGPVRLARVGAPMADIAEALETRLPRYGVIVGSAIHTAGLTGGRVAAVFDSLAQIASEDGDLARERRAATAQARISAWIVGGIPIVFLAWGFSSGRLGPLLRSGVGVGIISVGLSLVAAGSGTVMYMLRRSLA